MKYEYQKSGAYKQKDNPNYQGGKEVPCTFCKILVYRRPYELKRNKNHFCSSECHDNFRRKPKDPNRLRAKDMKGWKHPRWSGRKNCKICGKELFTRRKRQVLLCSEECKQESQRRSHLKSRGENHHSWDRRKIAKDCKVCSKEFFIIPAKKDTAFYCSVECRGIGTRNRITLECEHCGADFIAAYVRVRDENPRFCSSHCYRCYKGKTTLETKVLIAIQELGLEYIDEYRPKGTRKIFDFFLPALNVLIEADGDFWHYSEWAKKSGNTKRDQEKNEWAKENGYRLIRLRESDVNEFGALELLKKVL